FIFQQHLVKRWKFEKSGRLFYFRYICLKPPCDGRGCGCPGFVIWIYFFYCFISNPVNAVCVFIWFIISEFTQNVGDHQNTGGQAYGQSKNSYERKNLIPCKVAVGKLKIIPEHGIGLCG